MYGTRINPLYSLLRGKRWVTTAPLLRDTEKQTAVTVSCGSKRSPTRTGLSLQLRKAPDVIQLGEVTVKRGNR